MSDVVDDWSRADRALFALYASVLIGGPLFIIPLPLAYWRPRRYVLPLFRERGDDDAAQRRLDEF